MPRGRGAIIGNGETSGFGGSAAAGEYQEAETDERPATPRGVVGSAATRVDVPRERHAFVGPTLDADARTDVPDGTATASQPVARIADAGSTATGAGGMPQRAASV